MKAPVRRPNTRTQVGPNKRKDSYGDFIYPHHQGKAFVIGVGRVLQTDHPGCPKRVLLDLVVLEAFRMSMPSRRHHVAPPELAAALLLLLGMTSAPVAA